MIGRQLEKGFVNLFLSTLELEFSSTEMIVERGQSSEILEAKNYFVF